MTDGTEAGLRPAKRPSPGHGIKILYIAGCGRSGSTLMMRLLAEATGGVAVGELFHIWHHGYQENFVCGCGARFLDCPFWSEVHARMVGDGPEGVDADRMSRLQRRVHGPRALLPLRLPFLRSPGYRRAFHEYVDVLSRLYRNIAETAGVNVVIDSSKSPQLARMLELLPDAEIHVVHLVRDSRATAWSWNRIRAEPGAGDSDALMHRYPVWRSAMEWTANHAILLADRRRPSSYTICKYEEFVKDPRAELSRAIPWANGPSEPHLRTGEYVLQKSHSVTGNPNRFHSGPVAIAADAEWETVMPARDRLIVTLLSWPMLKWFRYPLRKQRRP